MSAHYNIDTTFGLTQPSGSTVTDCEKVQSVEVSALVGESGEYTLAVPMKTSKIEVTLNGTGNADLAAVASGDGTVGTLTVTQADQSESNKGRPTFTLKASSYATFSGSGGSGTSAGSAPAATDMAIVSATYAVMETLKASIQGEDLVLTGNAGQPAARGHCKRKGTYAFAGRGDLPSGLALGAGVGLNGFSGGKSITTKVMQNEKAGDWNGWSVDGEWYPEAA